MCQVYSPNFVGEKKNYRHVILLEQLSNLIVAKGLVADLALPHGQSAWEFRGERVRAAGWVACCNYFSKKRKRKSKLIVLC